MSGRDLSLRFILLSPEGPDAGRAFELNLDEVSVGTSGSIRLSDETLLPVHAVFVRQGATYLVRRASPGAMLFVNSREIDEEILNSMDEIRVGSSLLLFSIGEQPRDASRYTTSKLENRARSSSKLTIDPVNGSGPAEGDAVTRREFKTRRMDTEDEVDISQMRGALPKITMKVSNESAGVTCLDFHASQIVIGRTMGDCIIDDPDISRKHCSIDVHGRGRVYIHDHASTNGTFLNGTRVSYSLLKSGDLIAIGSTLIHIIIS